jgi:hypothetical protein
MRYISKILLGILLASGANAAVPPPSTPETTEVHAVMFVFEYDASGSIKHAQALGGYPSLDLCQMAMPKVAGFITQQIEKGLRAQLLCSGVRPATPADEISNAPDVTTL